jgi:NAD(P)-dependent dehydrogenase (short-subunit alcohol dehydrogenase family)
MASAIASPACIGARSDRARRSRRARASRAVVTARASRAVDRSVRGLDPIEEDAARGKVIVVTGANSGIGKEACKQLYAAGATVLVAARSREKATAACEEIARDARGDASRVDGDAVRDRRAPEEAPPLATRPRFGRAVPVVVDLGDVRSIARASAEILNSHPVVDVIVCNAGVAPDRAGNAVSKTGKPTRRTKDGFEETIGVNHLGHFALVRELRGALREGSRVVVTSGCVHDKSSPDGKNGAPPTLGDLTGLRRVLLTLVPIRPRSRGERRSLRTLPGASLRPGSLAFNPRHRRL